MQRKVKKERKKKYICRERGRERWARMLFSFRRCGAQVAPRTPPGFRSWFHGRPFLFSFFPSHTHTHEHVMFFYSLHTHTLHRYCIVVLLLLLLLALWWWWWPKVGWKRGGRAFPPARRRPDLTSTSPINSDFFFLILLIFFSAVKDDRLKVIRRGERKRKYFFHKKIGFALSYCYTLDHRGKRILTKGGVWIRSFMYFLGAYVVIQAVSLKNYFKSNWY